MRVTSAASPSIPDDSVRGKGYGMIQRRTFVFAFLLGVSAHFAYGQTSLSNAHANTNTNSDTVLSAKENLLARGVLFRAKKKYTHASSCFIACFEELYTNMHAVVAYYLAGYFDLSPYAPYDAYVDTNALVPIYYGRKAGITRRRWDALQSGSDAKSEKEREQLMKEVREQEALYKGEVADEAFRGVMTYLTNTVAQGVQERARALAKEITRLAKKKDEPAVHNAIEREVVPLSDDERRSLIVFAAMLLYNDLENPLRESGNLSDVARDFLFIELPLILGALAVLIAGGFFLLRFINDRFKEQEIEEEYAEGVIREDDDLR